MLLLAYETPYNYYSYFICQEGKFESWKNVSFKKKENYTSLLNNKTPREKYLIYNLVYKIK